MNSVRIRIYLAVFVLTLLPLFASFVAIKEVISSAMLLGLDSSVAEGLRSGAVCCRDAAQANPSESSSYRGSFDSLESLRESYLLMLERVPAIERSLLFAFLVVVSVMFGLAFAVSTWLNRSVLRIHGRSIDSMREAQSQLAYFQERQSWQSTAQRLVHEVKNPLTPIQLTIARLQSEYARLHDPAVNPEFIRQLSAVRGIIKEEINKILTWVDSFSRFATMPAVRLEPVALAGLFQKFLQSNENTWPTLQIELNLEQSARVLCDPILIRQVIFNLIKNSVEAATGANVKVKISSRRADDRCVVVRFADDGPGIPDAVKEQIFRPYVSTKLATGQGMGLGLAIANKIMLEHGGSIVYVESVTGCCFDLKFLEEQE